MPKSALSKFVERYIVRHGRDFRIKDIDPGDTYGFKPDKEGAAELLNAELEAEGSDKRVEVVVRESPAKGFDDDALQLLEVFGIGEGPDMFIQAHEWICAFQADGFVLKLDDYIAKDAESFERAVLGSVSAAYRAVSSHARWRLRQWLGRKNGTRVWASRCPDTYLHATLGLIDLAQVRQAHSSRVRTCGS